MSALKDEAEIDKYAGIKTSSYSSSEITIAGFSESGQLEILRRDLVPVVENGAVVDYRGIRRETIDVSSSESHMVSIVRGIETTARSILDGSYQLSSTDPILLHLKESIATDNGMSLSLHDMEQIAKQIARATSREHPREVGGPLQIAELTEDKVASFDEPIAVDYPVPTSIVDGRFDGSSSTNVGQAFESVSPHSILLLKEVMLVNSGQKLDNVFLFGSHLSHCSLTYNGSPNTILDKSNVITDSTLKLLPGADPDSQFIKQIKIDFPSLRIIDQTGKQTVPLRN